MLTVKVWKALAVRNCKTPVRPVRTVRPSCAMTPDTPASVLAQLLAQRDELRRQAKALESEIRQTRSALRSEDWRRKNEEGRQRIAAKQAAKRATADALLAKFKL